MSLDKYYHETQAVWGSTVLLAGAVMKQGPKTRGVTIHKMSLSHTGSLCIKDILWSASKYALLHTLVKWPSTKLTGSRKPSGITSITVLDAD